VHVCLVEPLPSTSYGFTYLPLGLLTIAGALRREGHSVIVAPELPSRQCDVLGISACTLQYKDAIGIAARSMARMIVLGGAHATTATADAMRSSAFDYAIVGDGEVALSKLLAGDKPETIAGLVRKVDGVLVMNPNLDTDYGFHGNKAADRASLPAYDLYIGEIGHHVGVSRNREYSWRFKWRRKNRPKFWRDFDTEITQLISLGVDEVTVIDEDFGSWHARTRSTINSLDRLGHWHCRAKTETVLKKRLDQALVSSKCDSVELDIGTASKRLLKEYKKPSLEEHELAAKLLADAGLRVTYKITTGLPGETVDSLRATQGWLHGKEARIERVLPLPGTPYYDEPARFAVFGYRVIWHDFCDYENSIVWKMDTIATSAFLEIEAEIRKECE